MFLCGRRYPEGEVEYTCPHCGIDGTLDVLYDYGQVKKELNREKLQKDPTPGMWRYWPVLPVHDRANIPSLAVGGTPLYENKAVAAEYGVKRFFVKDDGRNPTGSLKDRASGVAVARALIRAHAIVAHLPQRSCLLSGFAAAPNRCDDFVLRSTCGQDHPVAVYGARGTGQG